MADARHAFAAGLGLVLGLVLVLLVAAPASAESAAQVRELARRAHTDPGALLQLRDVRDVDGRGVDFEAALGEAEGADLDRRLDVIAADTANGGVPIAAPAARTEAERILKGRRFHPAEPPRPLRGAIHRVGKWLEPVLRPLGRWLAPVWRFLVWVYHTPLALVAIGLAVIALAAVVAARMGARRSRSAVGAAGHAGRLGRIDPKELERQADEAEAAGRYDHAFRLRFVAGVLRLDRAGVVEYRPSLTTGELVRVVPSPTFGPLAEAFDAIAYGGRETGREDLDRAKADWPRVLEEARP